MFLVSGGGSSMMELPLDVEISLDDTVGFHRALVASGASIVEMDCVRKHFSAVKGGRLAMAAGSARKVSLFISDVPPGRLDALASGPTIPDPTTSDECREIIRRHGIDSRFPASVRKFFAGEIRGDTQAGRAGVERACAAEQRRAVRGCEARAEALGFEVAIDNTCDDWPYEKAGVSWNGSESCAGEWAAGVCDLVWGGDGHVAGGVEGETRGAGGISNGHCT